MCCFSCTHSFFIVAVPHGDNTEHRKGLLNMFYFYVVQRESLVLFHMTLLGFSFFFIVDNEVNLFLLSFMVYFGLFKSYSEMVSFSWLFPLIIRVVGDVSVMKFVFWLVLQTTEA